MRVFASSIVDAAQTFLHSGYISAYPRPLYSGDYPGAYPEQYLPQLRLDVVESLRLQGEQLASVVTGSNDTAAAVATAATGPQWMSMLVGSLCLTGLMAAYYLMRDHFEVRWRVLAPTLSALVAAVVIGACGEETAKPLPTEPPWDGVQLRAYEQPEQATQVLLHGIIADALINVGQPVKSLPNIQNEVGLPTASPTEGEAYALLTYGIDGWGNEFRFESVPGSEYRVSSAGADGVFDTADDLGITVRPTNNGEFDSARHAWFIVKHEEQHYVVFHRWTGDFFEYNHEELARETTGTALFDLFTPDDFDNVQRAAVVASFDQVASGLGHTPLVLEVYGG